MNSGQTATPRHAATLILFRDGADGPRVLMGRRGAGARFMPSKFVFPGGAVDPDDIALAGRFGVAPKCAAQLLARAEGAPPPAAFALAAIRETWEETGLVLGAPGGATAVAVSEGWRAFFAAGLTPATEALTFVFRAITPPTRPMRFDARFFIAPAGAAAGDPDDLSRASGELTHLRWLTLPEARAVDPPFVTALALAEIEARLKAPETPRPAPFFHHAGDRSFLDLLERPRR